MSENRRYIQVVLDDDEEPSKLVNRAEVDSEGEAVLEVGEVVVEERVCVELRFDNGSVEQLVVGNGVDWLTVLAAVEGV